MVIHSENILSRCDVVIKAACYRLSNLYNFRMGMHFNFKHLRALFIHDVGDAI